MNDQDEIEEIAAEYVLGTLDFAERGKVERRRAVEPELDGAITAWERRLSPLLDVIDEQSPPEGTFEAVTRRLDVARERSDAAPDNVAALDAARLKERRRADFWRRTAISAMATAAALAMVIGFPLVMGGGGGPAETFVAVFNPQDKEPAFVLSVDFKTREVLVRRIGAEPIEDGSYQLWIVSKPSVPVPRSLGLLADDASSSRARLPEFEEAVLRRATFGISREPRGGSPTGQPSPGALHGTLIAVNN